MEAPKTLNTDAECAKLQLQQTFYRSLFLMIKRAEDRFRSVCYHCLHVVKHSLGEKTIHNLCTTSCKQSDAVVPINPNPSDTSTLEDPVVLKSEAVFFWKSYVFICIIEAYKRNAFEPGAVFG